MNDEAKKLFIETMQTIDISIKDLSVVKILCDGIFMYGEKQQLEMQVSKEGESHAR